MQLDLLQETLPVSDMKLMKTIDQIKLKFGKSIIQFACQGFKNEWGMKSAQRSPCYTTNWKELVRAH